MQIYSSNNCYHCTELKQQLINKGVDFEYMDLDDDKVRDEAIKLCEQTGNTELPIVVKDSKIFNRPTLEELL